jgi:uncharacterized damage-inducible protein DinB
MSLSQRLITDIESENENTRKLLGVVPQPKLDWKPHERSMTLGQLAGHIAEMPTWLGAMLEDELDFAAMAGSYKPFVPRTREELLSTFESNSRSVRPALNGKDDAFMRGTWTMRKGKEVLMQAPRADVIRQTMLHHLAHHRGQLTVYLRLLDVPVPGTYGPTADFPNF